MIFVRQVAEFGRSERRAIEALAGDAAAHDHQDPLNEQARLALSGRAQALHWVAVAGEGATLRDARSSLTGSSGIDAELAGSSGKDPRQGATLRDGRSSLATSSGGVVGYAQWQPDNASGQLVVHPDHRRRGVGTELLKAISHATDAPAVWAFGDLPAAQGFAAASGLEPARGLLVMERALGTVDQVTPPDGVTLRGFTWPDADGFLATNAAAFAGHPEQGHFSRADLDARAAEDWFDPDGLILATDAAGVLGFHWTKRHPDGTGEVYVIGVHPRAGGRGLGRVLLDAGLRHLADTGATRVILYVDADNARAVELYERNGFSVFHRDTLYRRP